MDKERIRPIALCLFRRGGRILVSEGFDSSKGEHYCRPLGGGIEFGESSRDAVLREIKEEVGAEVENLELVGVLESIFTYEGARGHQIVFVYDAEFRDKSLYERGELRVLEPEINAELVARWLSEEEMAERGMKLVPEALPGLLARR